MGKRDTFERNVKALTGATSLSKAVKGWRWVQDIELGKKEPDVSCELCGTRFRIGAVIRLLSGRRKRPAVITVGGTCLETLVAGRFAPATLAKRRLATSTSLTHMYQGLIDPGAWITWVVENAPPTLASTVAELKHLGMVASERELRLLVKYHDENRKYPRSALVPDWEAIDRRSVEGVPEYLTICEARRILSGLSLTQFERVLIHRGRRYVAEQITPMLDADPQWERAWATLRPLHRRFIVALCALIDRAVRKEGKLPSLDAKLEALPEGAASPMFAWHPKVGLGLVQDAPVDGDGMVNVYLWGRDECSSFKRDFWLSVHPKSESLVRRMEARAFWSSPAWYTGQRLEKKLADPSGRAAGPPPSAAAESAHLDEDALMRHFRMRQLMQVARFRLHGRKENPKCLAWVRRRIEARGVAWGEWLWMLSESESDPAVNQRLGAIVEDVCGKR